MVCCSIQVLLVFVVGQAPLFLTHPVAHPHSLTCSRIETAVGTIYFATGLGYEFYDSLYLATVTGTSVGYGDVSPSRNSDGELSHGGMWFSIVYVVVFFAFTAQLLGWIASQLFSFGVKFDIESSMRGSLTQRLLRVLDTNNDKQVDRAEVCACV